MKLALSVCALGIVAGAVTFVHHDRGQFASATGRLESTGGEKAPVGHTALQHRYFQRLDDKGRLDETAMMRAAAQRAELIQRQGQSIASPVWNYMGPGNVGGRIRAIVPHPTVNGTLYIASVGGGIWKTTNTGASWQALNDFLPSLCVGALILDPNNPNVLYAGTGESYFDTEFGENNKSAIIGVGILKSTDAGATWSILPSTQTPDFSVTSRLAMSPADSNTILASTNTGLFRTTNGGANWTKVYSGRVMDVDYCPTDATRVVAGIDASPGVVYSTDGGVNWANSSGIGTNIRCETVWSRSIGPNVYAGVSNGGFVKVWKSTNFGQTWTLRSTGTGPSTYEAYNNAIWVDPTNDNNVIVGGVYIYRSTNGGANISRVFNNVHPDLHVIQEGTGFSSTNRVVFFGHDGGISRTADYTGSAFSDLNNGLGITQFYGGAVNDSTGRIVAGAQDNYTQVYTGSQNWTGVIGGDGVFCANDPAFPNTFYAGYYYLNMFRSTDGGLNYPTDITGGITDRDSATNCNFVPYLTLDPNQSNTMLACARRLWRSTNVRTGNPPAWTAIKPPIASAPGGDKPGRDSIPDAHFAPEAPYNLSYVAIAKSDSNVIWASHNNGQVYKTTNGLAGSPSWSRVDLNGPLPQRWVSCIVIDNADPNHVYLSYMGFQSDSIWETTDGGATFHQVTGSAARHIPAVSVSSIALDPQRPGHLLAGTDLGVFTTWDNGASWSAETDGPGTVAIDFMQWRNNSQLMLYTYGRGCWQGNVSPVDTAVAPTSFSVFRGGLQGGGIAEVASSDDTYMVVRNGIVVNQSESPVTVDFTGTAPSRVASSITVKCEASASSGGLVRKLQAFNYDTNQWVELDSRNATTTDQMVTVTITSNVSSYINPANNQIRLRFLLRVGTIAGAASWTARIDQIGWTIAE